MPKYFLIKEQIHNTGCVGKKDVSVIQELSCDNYNDTIKELKDQSAEDSDIIYAVEVVAKRFGNIIK